MKLRLLLSLLFLSVVPGFAQSGPQRIAVIDVNQVMSGSAAGKAASARVEAAQDERGKKADADNAEIQKLTQDLGVHQLAWSETQIAERHRQINEKQAALDRYVKASQKELADLRDRELMRLEKQLGPIIDTVAKEKNLDAVFNKYESGLIFAADRIDITAEVIARFNAGK